MENKNVIGEIVVRTSDISREEFDALKKKMDEIDEMCRLLVLFQIGQKAATGSEEFKNVVSKLNSDSDTKLNLNSNTKCNKRKRPVINTDLGMIYDSCAKASKFLGLDESAVRQCCSGKAKTAGGFHWRYLDEYERQNKN